MAMPNGRSLHRETECLIEEHLDKHSHSSFQDENYL